MRALGISLIIGILILAALSATGAMIYLTKEKGYPFTINPQQSVGKNLGDLPERQITFSSIGNSLSFLPLPPIPPVLETQEKDFYSKYLTVFTKSNGAVISNFKPVSWCTNGCIGCDQEITSEGIARLAYYAAYSNDKQTLDREVNFYYSTMMHSQTGHMMWKLNSDGSVGSCGGQNSAVDAELIFIEALFKASDQWGTDSEGRKYKQTAQKVMDSLKGGVIVKGNEKYLPFCMYAQGSETRPCLNKVFLGYTNLRALKKMCQEDDFWCSVYGSSTNLMVRSVQGKGAYSAYDVDSDTFLYENADIHPNWVLKHLAEDGHTSLINPYYQEARKYFYEDTSLCLEFRPDSGCIKTKAPPLRVYANYLEMASAMKDTQFRNDLIKYINERRAKDPDAPLASIDNYGNIVILEAYADARQSGAYVG